MDGAQVDQTVVQLMKPLNAKNCKRMLSSFFSFLFFFNLWNKIFWNKNLILLLTISPGFLLLQYAMEPSLFQYWKIGFLLDTNSSNQYFEHFVTTEYSVNTFFASLIFIKSQGMLHMLLQSVNKQKH